MLPFKGFILHHAMKHQTLMLNSHSKHVEINVPEKMECRKRVHDIANTKLTQILNKRYHANFKNFNLPPYTLINYSHFTFHSILHLSHIADIILFC